MSQEVSEVVPSGCAAITQASTQVENAHVHRFSALGKGKFYLS